MTALERLANATRTLWQWPWLVQICAPWPLSKSFTHRFTITRSGIETFQAFAAKLSDNIYYVKHVFILTTSFIQRSTDLSTANQEDAAMTEYQAERLKYLTWLHTAARALVEHKRRLSADTYEVRGSDINALLIALGQLKGQDDARIPSK